MPYTDNPQRLLSIAGLRTLADSLEENPLALVAPDATSREV